ncbi:hypothetical protein T439DRAFT_321312 [Meredithblackwellia eburnea MCA 4105]
MSKVATPSPSHPPAVRGREGAGGKPGHVPVVLILDSFIPAVIGPYCNAVISALQALHPGTQLLLTSLTPTSHSLPTHSFLAPSPFLASLPTVLRRPPRPAPSVWRSACGLLRSINTARRLLEGTIGGVGSEKRTQLPRYIVVISGSDLEIRPGDDVWLEDEEASEPWQQVAATFTKGAHMTTLFSLISLGHTPNLEQFWKASTSRFPANLVYTSTSPTPGINFNFPLFSNSHACFLIGFYNSRNNSNANANASASATPTPQSQQGASSPALPANKRLAANENQQAGANKKQKPNTPTIPITALPATTGGPNSVTAQQQAQYLALKAGQAAAAGVSGTVSAPPAQPGTALPAPRRTDSPVVPPPSGNLSNESLQQYINEMKAATNRAGGGPPLNLAEVQAAMTTFSSPQLGQTTPTMAPQQQPTQQQVNQQQQQQLFLAQQRNQMLQQQAQQQAQAQQQQQTQQQQQQNQQQQQQQQLQQQLEQQRLAAANALRPGAGGTSFTPQQQPQPLASLQQMPPDIRQKIEQHYTQIRAQVASGALKQEDANQQIKRLQELANSHHVNLQARQQAAAAAAASGTANANALQQTQQAQAAQQAAMAVARQRMASAPQQGVPPPPVAIPGQGNQNQYASQQALQQQYGQQMAAFAQNLPAAAQVPPQPTAQATLAPPQPQRGNTGADPAPPVWRGAISWSVGEPSGVKQECSVYCSMSPMQTSASRDLSEIKFPPTFRVSSLVPVKMTELQDLAMKHTLPALSIRPLPNESLRSDLREKLSSMSNGVGNEELYTMFAQSMDVRGNCGIVRFSAETPNVVMVIVAMPKQNRFIGIVFSKIPVPEHWLHGEAGSVPRPMRAGAPQLSQQQPNMNSFQAMQQYTQQPQSQVQVPQPHQQQQQPQQAQFNPNISNLGGLSFEQLSTLLGPDQLAAILGNQQQR